MIPTLERLRAKALRLWTSAAYHRGLLAGRPWSPRTFPIALPTAKEALEDFSALRAAVERLRALDGAAFRLAWTPVQYRSLGPQLLPTALWLDREDDYLAFIGKQAEAARYKDLVQATAQRLPGLLPLLERKPALPLQWPDAWPRLLAVAGWFLRHPRPGLHLRQIDLPGIDTKFIESHKGILADLLDAVLPPEAVLETVPAAALHGFERRFGLAFEEPQVRFRILDPAIKVGGLDDLTVPLPQFATLRLPVRRVFITENKVNGLAFPAVPEAIVIFGLGYGLEVLRDVPWLGEVELHYWGDLDSHGFAMLARLRRWFPQVRTMLMDPGTLRANLDLCGEEPAPVDPDGSALTGEEREALRMLQREDGASRRLEQERIPFHLVRDALRAWVPGSAVEHQPAGGVVQPRERKPSPLEGPIDFSDGV